MTLSLYIISWVKFKHELWLRPCSCWWRRDLFYTWLIRTLASCDNHRKLRIAEKRKMNCLLQIHLHSHGSRTPVSHVTVLCLSRPSITNLDLFLTLTKNHLCVNLSKLWGRNTDELASFCPCSPAPLSLHPHWLLVLSLNINPMRFLINNHPHVGVMT